MCRIKKSTLETWPEVLCPVSLATLSQLFPPASFLLPPVPSAPALKLANDKIKSIKSIRCQGAGFCGGRAVKTSPASAGDSGFNPWSKKIPHAMEQLSPCATTTEPKL